MIGGFVGGKLCDIFLIKNTAFIGTCLYMVNCLLSILVYSIDCFPLSGFVCFIWGFVYHYIQAN